MDKKTYLVCVFLDHHERSAHILNYAVTSDDRNKVVEDLRKRFISLINSNRAEDRQQYPDEHVEDIAEDAPIKFDEDDNMFVEDENWICEIEEVPHYIL